MAFTRKNEEAVSPVIGVILMVAITVILAAVIAAFVFGMAGNIQKTKVVAATEYRNSSSFVIATYQGGQDASSLQSINWSVDGVLGNVWVNNGGTMTSTAGGLEAIPSTNGLLNVGSSVVIPATNPGKNHIVGTATFIDGSTQVIVDTTL
jgi:archaeal type IV pilus assembly protein PilA